VNNAGTVNRVSVLEMELSEWERVLATNLTGAFLCTKHAGRVMASQGSGKVINISSLYGIMAPSKGLQAAYTASKHGLIGLTRANAVELAPLGIQVNAILPGWHITEINRELTAPLWAKPSSVAHERALGRTKRLGRHLPLPGLKRFRPRERLVPGGGRRLLGLRRVRPGLIEVNVPAFLFTLLPRKGSSRKVAPLIYVECC